MKPVLQSRFGGPDKPGAEQGNCYAAALASILELPLEKLDIPIDDAWSDAEWDKAFTKHVESLGLGLTLVNMPASTALWLHGIYYLATGQSYHGDWAHCVVYRNGKLVHDPNPTGKGLDGPVKLVTVLVWNTAKHTAARTPKTHILCTYSSFFCGRGISRTSRSAPVETATCKTCRRAAEFWLGPPKKET